MAAEIGSLLVRLGIDTAQYDAGLRTAQSSLDRWGKSAAVATAAVAAAAAAAATAIGIAVKASIDNADAMGEMAQRVGVSVEALSQLSWAAKMSGLETEQLTGGLTRLTAQMAAAATNGAGPAATAFAALGISVTDASGNLRAADEVFADIAEGFSSMEDGATKTSMAISIFGRSGAELITLLNSGREGLAAFARESDQLGQTISTETAREAGDFNDALDRMEAAFTGVANKIATAVLPSLNELADVLTDPQMLEAVSSIAAGLAGMVTGFADAIKEAAPYIEKLIGWVGWLNEQVGDPVANTVREFESIGQGIEWLRTHGSSMVNDAGGLRDLPMDDTGLPVSMSEMNRLSGAGMFEGTFSSLGLPPSVAEMPLVLGEAEQAALDLGGIAIPMLDDAVTGLGSSTDGIGDSFDAATDRVSAFKYGVEDAAEKAAEAAAAMQKAFDIAFDSLGSSALVGIGALKTFFGESKALATAEAIVHGILAVQKALGSAPPPFNFIAAGAAFVAAASNVAAINMTSESSTTMPSMSSVPSVGAGAGAAPAAQQINVTLNGQSYGRDQIRSLLEQMGEWTQDGSGTQIVVGV